MPRGPLTGPWTVRQLSVWGPTVRVGFIIPLGILHKKNYVYSAHRVQAIPYASWFWNIYQHWPEQNHSNVGKYTIHGAYGIIYGMYKYGFCYLHLDDFCSKCSRHAIYGNPGGTRETFGHVFLPLHSPNWGDSSSMDRHFSRVVASTFVVVRVSSRCRAVPGAWFQNISVHGMSLNMIEHVQGGAAAQTSYKMIYSLRKTRFMPSRCVSKKT